MPANPLTIKNDPGGLALQERSLDRRVHAHDHLQEVHPIHLQESILENSGTGIRCRNSQHVAAGAGHSCDADAVARLGNVLLSRRRV